MIRILLAEVLGLTAAVVKEAILTQPDMAIVGEVGRADDVSAVVAQGEFDVVVTSLSGAHVASAYQRLLFEFPQVALVAISADGHRVDVYDRKVVREVSPEQLLEAIREVARDRGDVGVTQ